MAAQKVKDRRLSTTEIKRFGSALAQLSEENENPTGLAAIRFIALTSFRRSEALLLEKSWIDEDDRSVKFPDTKTGKQTRIIGQAAAREIKLQLQHCKSNFVFPADLGDGSFVGLPRVLGRVLKRARIEGGSLHTLRHTFASLEAEMGFSELTIAGLLGHASRGVTLRYIHIDEALVLAASKASARKRELLDCRQD